HNILRFGHEVDAKEIEDIRDGDHDCRNQLLVAAAEQLAEVEGKGLGIEVEAHLAEEVQAQIKAAPCFSQEEVALCVRTADQTDAGAHQEGWNGGADYPDGGAQVCQADGAPGL